MPPEKSKSRSRIARTQPEPAGKPARKTAPLKPALKPKPRPETEPETEPEPEPLDPKMASKAIGKHIEKKKATRTIAKPPKEQPAPAAAQAVLKPAGKPPAVAEPAKPAPRSRSAAADKPQGEAAPPKPAAPVKAGPPGGCPPCPGEREEILRALKVSDRDLIVIIDQSPESLSDEWIRIQAGDNAQPAVRISKVEAEFLLCKKTVLE